ncbi:hypothetical protein AVEN_258013-1 [Araneus ventricosus]|uniref:Uncharacterized protein n=1 Tax=Araneus ventricosus TaxID=182803 RepID=A0A4Y2Q664_ARAVE|nr:hypothetical protein AVEN_258013-1 [Araneus ventricosus]
MIGRLPINGNTATSPLPVSHDREDHTAKSPEQRKRNEVGNKPARPYASLEGPRDNTGPRHYSILYGGSNCILPGEILDKPLLFVKRTRRALLESLRATTVLKRTRRADYCVKSFENFQVCCGGKASKILCAWRQPVPRNPKKNDQCSIPSPGPYQPSPR